MSRIGKKPIAIAQNVQVQLNGQTLTIQGPKGTITQAIPPDIVVQIEDNNILLGPRNNKKNTLALWGLCGALLRNHIEGVVNGFEKKLEVRGIGYKASLENKKLCLDLGFSHSVYVDIPEDINVAIEKQIITITGADKQKVGQFAAQIRALKKPEPYQGKGIRYVGEVVRKKEGKKAGKQAK